MSVPSIPRPRFVLFLIACLGLLLAGCGGEPAEESDASQDTQTDSAVDTMDTGDTGTDFQPSDTVDPNTGRVSGNLLALYLFNEDQEQFVYDRSNDGHPIDLFNRIEELGSRLVDRNGYSFDYSSWETSGLASMGPATWVTDRIMASGEFTFEAWFNPADVERDNNDARILSLSRNSSLRNFTIMQAYDRIGVRLRTTDEDGGDENGTPTLWSDPGVLSNGQETHVAVTFRDENLTAYVNGAPIDLRVYEYGFEEVPDEEQPEQRPGTLENWDPSCVVTVGNEFSGDRSFEGEIYLAAIYNRALSQQDIERNIDAGSQFDLAPGGPREPNEEAPVAPTIRATVDGENSNVELEWSYSSDDQAISHYIVFRNGGHWLATRDQSTVDESRGPGDRVAYSVAAVDVSGNMNEGNTVLVQLPGAANYTTHLHRTGNNRHWNEHGDAWVPIADRADLMIEKLQPTDLFAYLDRRAAQGFNTIIFNALPATSTGTGADGSSPFNMDGTPNDLYWTRMDVIVDEVERRDFKTGFILTPGDWMTSLQDPAGYAQFLADRYASPFYLLGNGQTPTAQEETIINEMGAAIREERSRSEHFVSVLPPRDGTLLSFESADWNNVNFFATGADKDAPIWVNMEQAFPDTEPYAKPSLDMEGVIEDAPSRFWESTTNPRLNAYDVRKALWRSFFGGGAGFIYQAQGVSNFWTAEEPNPNGERLEWTAALELEGVHTLEHLNNFIKSRPGYVYKVPDQSLIFGNAGTGATAMRATVVEDDWGAVYMPQGQEVTLNLDILEINGDINVWWYSPRTGSFYAAGSQEADGAASFTPPTTGAGNDWILLLDDAERQYPPPGVSLADYGD